MGTTYGYGELGKLIPETPPLLMVDRLEIADDGEGAVGIKAITMDEAFFQGHFPGGPILPGMLQVAAMFQLSAAVMRSGLEPGMIPCFSAMKRIKFRHPVLPGDLLRTETVLKETDGSSWTFEATASVGSQKACSGSLVLTGVDPAAIATAPLTCDVTLPEEWSETVADAPRIGDMIPHRFPFQLLDRIAAFDCIGGSIVAIKNVSAGEPWFRGTTELPLLPAYLQIEAAAQAACAVALQVPVNHGKIGYFMSVDKASFTGVVRPGDQLVMVVDVNQRGRFGMAEANLLVARESVARASMKFVIVDAPDTTA